ncbi:MAG: polysaccharide deacetylase family protein [Propionibacteriaceae bacterium]
MTTRRAFLFGLAAVALSGCAVPDDEPPESSKTPSSTPESISRNPTPSILASVTPTVTPSKLVAIAKPTREEIIATYGQKTPQEWGLAVTGTITQTTALAKAAGKVALTFDACVGSGGSGYDAALIKTLRDYKIRATLLLNARWIMSNGSLAKELADDPLFEVQSHGSCHIPLSVNGKCAYGIPGTKNISEIYNEVLVANDAIASISSKPVTFFRPGTAYADDIAAAIARDLGMPIISFSVNGDGGATFTADQVRQELGNVQPGDVVISHMNQPQSCTAQGYARSLPMLCDKGITFGTLSEVCS